MTRIHANTTKKTCCQPQFVHSLGILIAENVTFPQFRDFRPRTRCETCALLGFYAASISYRRFRKTVGGCEILTAALVKIQVIWDASSFRLVNSPSSSGLTVQDEGTTFHRNVRNLSPVDRAESSSTCVRTSCLTEQKTVPGRVTVYDASFTDL